MQNIFERAFASIMVYWMFILSLRLMTDDNSTGVDGDSLEILLKIFLTLVERFTLLVISLVRAWTMRSSDFSLIMSSSLSRIFSLVPSGKYRIFTLWLTPRPSLRSIRSSFSYSKVLHEPLFCFELELERSFLFQFLLVHY